MRDDLTLQEQASLTAGRDFWHTVPVERAGIPTLRVTDGPSGARGDRWSAATSTCVPCGTALAATWDRALVRRVGCLLADETRAKGAGVLLAPTVNLHRHPITGRHFECFSEDPYLTAELAVAYINGLQEKGVGAVVKHLVCNDQEHERHTISVDVDERPLRELYLVPFEAAVQAGVWGVMGAYNKLGGTYCCEHHELLVKLLRDEWGFDGLVMSDWFGTHSTTAVAAGLDLEMPGPAKFLGDRLVEAVERGAVEAGAVHQAATRVAQLVERAGSRNGAAQGESAAEVTRLAATEAIVLLRNTGVLPLDASHVRRVAVIGPQADRLAVQGGGSAEVSPSYVSSPLEAIRARGVEVVHAPGAGLVGPTPLLDYRWLPDQLDVELYANADLAGEPVAREKLMRSLARWGGSPIAGSAEYSARVSGEFVPDRSGSWLFGLSSPGHARLLLDGQVITDQDDSLSMESLFSRGTAEATTELELTAGRTYALVAELRMRTPVAQSGVRVGARPLPAADAIRAAVDAAASADVAVVVVGYDGNWESEGRDRRDMNLPGDQDELVRAVLAANPRTIVAVNAGAPVTMDWADNAAAVLQLWFPGMEGGNALADILFGDANPSGRLPTTFPRRLSDSPATAFYPGENGVVRYGEGLLIGYRHYDKRHVEPRFCFGHGLSYTRFEYSGLSVAPHGDGLRVALEVRNTGTRRGAEVVQVYVRDVGAADFEPDKQLRQFARVELEPGQSLPVALDLPRRAFEYWDPDAHAWALKPGEREILVGASSRDIRLSAHRSLGA
jgi:beta-glucosidase